MNYYIEKKSGRPPNDPDLIKKDVYVYLDRNPSHRKRRVAKATHHGIKQILPHFNAWHEEHQK